MAIENLVAGRRVTAFCDQHGLSDRALAKRVFNRCHDPKPFRNAAGLAVKVGHLKKGSVTWWLKHPDVAQALADELERDVSELEIRDSGEAESHVFRFEDLPDLRALDLRLDTLCVLGQPNWFSNEWFDQTAPVWIEASPGAGKTLAARWHAAQGSASVVRVARLVDALERLADGPLVIDVGEAHQDSDRIALQQLGSRTHLLVLAPFSPPENEGSTAPKFNEDTPFRHVESAAQRSGFTCRRWQPEPSWRVDFLRWIAERQQLGDVWVERLLKLIDDLDPKHSLFGTPGALLPLLRFTWTNSPRAFRPSALVEDWLPLTIARNANDRSPCSLWLQSNGADLVRALVDARFADVSLPWHGGLSLAQWARLVPSRLAARLAGDFVRRELTDLCEVPAQRRVKEVESAARRLEAPSPEESIQYLVAARLLRPVGVDSLDLHPRWVAEGRAAAWVLGVVEKQDPSKWGRWSVDEARRPIVDAALDRLEAAQFKDVAKRTVNEWSATSLGSAGAIEALFCAVARRLRRGARPLDAKCLGELWRVQQRLIQHRDGSAPEPLTRPGLWGRSASRPEWLASCWTWAFRVDSPAEAVPPEDAWLFPGWTRPRLSTAPEWLDWMHPRDQEEPEGWAWVRSMVRSIVEGCDDPDLPERVPEVLFPEILRASTRKGWKITEKTAEFLFCEGSTPSVAMEAVASLAEGEQLAIARNIWQALIIDKVAPHRIEDLARSPVIFDFVVQRLSDEDIRRAVRRKKIAFAFLDPVREREERRLPLSLWEAGLSELLINGQHSEPIPQELGSWPQWTGPIVEALIGKLPNVPDWLGIRNLWAVDPSRALRRTEAAYPDDPNAAHWISEGWMRRQEAILNLIEQHPGRPLPKWVCQWLSRSLRDAPGQEADRIFSLLADAPSPAVVPRRPV